jgi:hypothetical protein
MVFKFKLWIRYFKDNYLNILEDFTGFSTKQMLITNDEIRFTFAGDYLNWNVEFSEKEKKL